MEAKHRQFLSEARYTIAGQERRAFSNLPPSERDAFVEEFWKKRDSNPATEANRVQGRVLPADRGGQPLILGRRRQRLARGPGPGPHPARTSLGEIRLPPGPDLLRKTDRDLVLRLLSIVFIDNDWNGTYDIDPLSAQQIALINKAQMELKPQLRPEKTLFDFLLSVEKVQGGEILIRIRVPYGNLWFTAEKGGFKTGLELNLSVFDRSRTKVWDFKETYTIETTDAKLKEAFKDDYVIEVPARIDGGPGTYSLKAGLKNGADEVRAEKNLDFEI